jgi:hypothetical protein
MDDPEIPIRVNLSVSQISPHGRCKDLHFFNRPAECPGEKGKTHALSTPIEVFAHPFPKLLESLVFWPCVDWPLDGRSHNVHKARALHHVRNVCDCIQGKAGFGRAVVHVVVPADQGRIGGQRAVVAFYDKVDIVDLQIAVCFEELKALVDIALPVFECANHHLRVDVVELAREGPVLFKVVDFKVQVRWYAGEGLVSLYGKSRGDVQRTCAVVLALDQHRALQSRDVRRLGAIGEWECGVSRRDITKVNSPDARSAAGVKSSIYMLDGCEIELLVEGKPHDVMLKIYSGQPQPLRLMVCSHLDVLSLPT